MSFRRTKGPSGLHFHLRLTGVKLFIFEGHKHRSIVDHFPSKEKIYYNFFSSNSCNFLTGSSRGKEDCPKGYVLCKNATEPTGFTLFESLVTFKEAEIKCKALNTTMCKKLCFLDSSSDGFFSLTNSFQRSFKSFCRKEYQRKLFIYLDGFWTHKYLSFQVK